MVIGVLLIAYIATLFSTQTYSYQPFQPFHGSAFFVKEHKSIESLTTYKSQKVTFLAATGISEKEENVLSKSKEREVNSGLFRKISQSNKVFEYDEILSSDDVDEYQKRFHSLMALFPEVPESELRTLVFISPLLLALETSSLQTAVDRLRHELPFIDPSYVIAQRSCGLDLLLSCMSPLFDLETRRNDVISVIGKERNVTEFLRRVPHCLTPRYLLALSGHCITLKEFLHLDAKASLDIVERWPGILGIDLVQSLSRFNTSLHRLELIPVHETSTFFLTKILRSVPRSLMQDMPRRAYVLRQSFPFWDLPTIISKYPRILTQKVQGLKNQYETLQGLLDPLEISADNFINMSPRSLGYNPHQLLATAHSIAAALPGLTVHDIYKRVPRLLTVRTKEVLLPQIRKLKKSFSTTKSSAHANGEHNKNNFEIEKLGKGESVKDTKSADKIGGDVEVTTYSAASRGEYMVDDDEDSLYSSSSSEEEEQSRIRMAQILTQISLKDAEEAAQCRPGNVVKEYKEDEKRKERGTDALAPQSDPSPVISPKGIVSVVSLSDIAPLPSVISSDVESIPYITPHATRIEEINDTDDESEINVTRIIIGNLNIFIDRHPYFTDKVNGWIKDFGPSLAFAVLSAVPAVLTKKTTTVRPILKRLYTLIAESEGLNNNNDSDKKSVASEVSRSNSVLYRALNVLLLQAPSLLKKKPADVDIRLQQLADLLEHSLVPHKSNETPQEDSSLIPKEYFTIMKAQVLSVRVPRLLIESKMDRVIFRHRLVFYFEKNSSNMNGKKGQNPAAKIKKKSGVSSSVRDGTGNGVGTFKMIESVVEGCPQILAAPSSTIARLFFVSKYLAQPAVVSVTPGNKGGYKDKDKMQGSRTLVPLSPTQIEQLLDCNTKGFLRCLSSLGGEDCQVLDCAYGAYLQSLLKELTPAPNQSTPTPALVIQTALPSTRSDPRDSEVGDLEPEDSTFKFDGETDPLIGAHPGLLTGIDLGSSDFERLLCGVFNDLCSVSGASDCAISGRESADSAASSLSVSNVGLKDVVTVSAEVERIDRLCLRVGSVLMDLAR